MLTWDAGPVREPRFSITADGHLMVHTSVCFVSKTPRADGNYYQLTRSSSGSTDQAPANPDGNGVLRPAKEVIRSLGGPKLLRLRDGRFLLAGRASGISLFWVDPKNAILTRFASIAGTSYAGIVEHEDAIWVTCGEGAAAAIYLAKVKLQAGSPGGRSDGTRPVEKSISKP